MHEAFMLRLVDFYSPPSQNFSFIRTPSELFGTPPFSPFFSSPSSKIQVNSPLVLPLLAKFLTPNSLLSTVMASTTR